MNKICTSIEQSNKLIELGIDRQTSDMYYWCGEDLRIGGYRVQMEEFDIPAWSLSALLELMPDVINLNGINYQQQEFKVKNNYCYCYADERFPISFNGQPVDAAFEMVCWLKENRKI